MKDQIQPLFDYPWCHVVLVQDEETALQLEQAILESHPEYRYEINPVFHNEKKLGPLTVKNNKKLWDILMHTKAIRDVKGSPGMGRQPAQAHYLRREMSCLDLEAYEHRVPSALSHLQKERASMLYDVLNGRKEFLINDFRYPDGRSNGYTVTPWMSTYEGFEWDTCELIWITSMTFQELLDKEGEKKIREGKYSLKGYDSFFTVENGKVIPLDKNALLAGKVAVQAKAAAQPPRRQEPAATRPASAPTRAERPTPPAPKKAESKTWPLDDKYQEGRKYDTFSGYGITPPVDDYPFKAAELYTEAAEAGHMAAQYCLGRFHEFKSQIFKNNKNTYQEEQEQALYWYVMATFNENYDEHTADKEMIFINLGAGARMITLLQQMENGAALLRQYAGAKAEVYIKRVERMKGSME